MFINKLWTEVDFHSIIPGGYVAMLSEEMARDEERKQQHVHGDNTTN